tara:strand:+ start:4784 stop:5167 length:384 start_codon:yes stop_codon:yes gene_type:complete
MAGTSNYLEAAALDAVLRNTTYTSPATVYVALYNADPTDADSATEITGNGYARQSCAFSRTAGVASNTAAVEYPTATGSWGTVSYIGVRDAASAGNLLYHGALTSAKAITTGDIFRIPAADLNVTMT